MRREFVARLLMAAACTVSGAVAQKKTAEPDLAKLAESNGLTVFNRSAAALNEGDKRGVRLDAKLNDGVAWVPNVDFSNGTIELDIRGKDLQQKSFVGVAFHGVDDTTYDAIYFRPFNFKAEDPARRVRAVQYVSHPTYPWQKLRADHPNKYEKAVNPVPDPNGWFHVRVVVASPKVSVFVNDATEPTLVVDQLSNRGKGRVGVWVGNGSEGDFANLKITPAP